MPSDDPALFADLERALARAWQAPFFRRKLEDAGVRPGPGLDRARWTAIPPTTKDELRALARFEEEVVVAPVADIAEYWRSGGVTGRPLFYPRTHADVEASLEGFANALALCGVGPLDVFHCALPIGIHPAGQQTARAAERLGAATLWAGAGNQTPSAAQIELIHELEATVWCGMASFGLHLGHLAEAAGKSLAESKVHTVITTAEVLSPKKRELLERLWGARVRDMFGMSEVTLMGAECGRRPGLHVWRTHSFCEVLDPDTLVPVKPGEVGVLCVTPLRTANAVPFLRWLSGDVVRLEEGCDCERAGDPRLIHAGRTLAFFKVKGVNLNHAEMEEALYGLDGLRDFRVIVRADDLLAVEVEGAAGLETAVGALFGDRFGLRVAVTVLERGTIARSLEGQIKAQRFVDER